jgi:hypothetical protein
MVRRKSAPIRYAIKYERAGSQHDGSIEIKDGDRLHIDTPHGSDRATLNPMSDVRSLTASLLAGLGARLVSIDPDAL